MAGNLWWLLYRLLGTVKPCNWDPSPISPPERASFFPLVSLLVLLAPPLSCGILIQKSVKILSAKCVMNINKSVGEYSIKINYEAYGCNNVAYFTRENHTAFFEEINMFREQHSYTFSFHNSKLIPKEEQLFKYSTPNFSLTSLNLSLILQALQTIIICLELKVAV